MLYNFGKFHNGGPIETFSIELENQHEAIVKMQELEADYVWTCLPGSNPHTVAVRDNKGIIQLITEMEK